MSRKSRKQLEEFRDGVLKILNTFQTEMSDTLDKQLIDMAEVDKEEASIQMDAVKTGINVLVEGLNKEMLDMIIIDILDVKKGRR